LQSTITVHGAMSLMLDSLLCALGPLLFMTSYVPEMKSIDSEQMVSKFELLAFAKDFAPSDDFPHITHLARE